MKEEELKDFYDLKNIELEYKRGTLRTKIFDKLVNEIMKVDYEKDSKEQLDFVIKIAELILSNI